MWSTERLRLAAAGAAALALLSACASAPPADNGRVASPLTPLDHYPVRAVERTEDVALAVHPQGALSPAQDAALASLAQAWREAGGGSAMIVQHPAAGGPDARFTAQAAADRLVSLGVAPAALRLGPYDSGPGAPVLARFEHLAAEAPDCNRGWDNLMSTNGNGASTHFGCANAHNFAVMLADPHDLAAPRGVTPADAERRALIMENFHKGAVTASAKDAQASGAVSHAVN